MYIHHIRTYKRRWQQRICLLALCIHCLKSSWKRVCTRRPSSCSVVIDTLRICIGCFPLGVFRIVPSIMVSAFRGGVISCPRILGVAPDNIQAVVVRSFSSVWLAQTQHEAISCPEVSTYNVVHLHQFHPLSHNSS